MDAQILKSLKEKVHKLPMQPGVYIMKDKNNTVIYVGKAKKLKNRVSSYFRPSTIICPRSTRWCRM